MLAAYSPTRHLSIPLINNSVLLGDSNLMPSGISTSTGCENPAVITNWLPFRAKRYPTPTASNFFSKPSVTPIIAL